MPILKYDSFGECTTDQKSKGKSEEAAAKICGFLEKKFKKGEVIDTQLDIDEEIIEAIETGAKYPDLATCQEDQEKKGKSPEGAKKICDFLNKTKQISKKGDYQEEEKKQLSKDDFSSVGECVKHCMDTLDKTEEQANTFCTKLFEAKVAEVKTTNKNEMIQRYSQTNEATGKLFIKAFLLDDSVNLNKWGVNPASIERNISTFIGKPLVLTENFDHPVVDDMSYGHALQYQDIYRIGTIIDIIKMDKQTVSPYGNSYYAIIEITNDAARQALNSDTLPLYVSPAIAQMTLDDNPEQLDQWLALHLAVVDDPAYTVKKAMITGRCSGDQNTCLVRLRQAHIEKFGYGQCGFCVKGKLLSVLTAKTLTSKTIEIADNVFVDVKPITGTDSTLRFKLDTGTTTLNKPITLTTSDPVIVSGTNLETVTAELQPLTLSTETINEIAKKVAESTGAVLDENITESNTKIDTSLESQNQKLQQVHSMENTNPTQNVADVPSATAPEVKPVVTEVAPAPVQTPESSGIDLSKSGETASAILKAEYIQYKAEATILKEQKAALIKKLAEREAELNTLKESMRKTEIASVVTAELISDDSIREETIKFFVEQGLSADQVRHVYENVGVKKNTVHTANYEPKMPLVKTAKRSELDHDVEAIMGLADLIVRDDGGVA
jgi:hypothetical protein